MRQHPVATVSPIEAGTEVDLALEDRRLVIIPPDPSAYALADLLAGVSEENLHGEVESGPPQGAEEW